MAHRIAVALALLLPFVRSAAATTPPAAGDEPFWTRLAPFAASAAFDESGARVGFATRLRWTPGGGPTRRDASGAARTPPPFALEGGVHASDWRSGASPVAGTAIRLTEGSEVRRVWLGMAALDRGSEVPASGRWSLGMGIAQVLRSLTVHADAYAMRGYVQGGFFRPELHVLGFPDSTILGPLQRHPARDPLWTTTRLALRWQRGPGWIEASGGVTVGDLIEPRRWARLCGRLQVTSGAAMELTFGQQEPSVAAFDPTRAPGTALALTWTPALRAPSLVPPAPLEARSWQLAHLDGKRFAVHLRCPQARRVELRGDFSDWEPVQMQRVGAGWWERVAPFDAGLQKIQVRIDGGAWTAPEGLPLQRDGDRVSGTIVVSELRRGE